MGKVDKSGRLTRGLALGLAGPFPVTNGEGGEGLGQLCGGQAAGTHFRVARGLADEPGSAVSMGEDVLSLQPAGNTWSPGNQLKV